MLPTTSLAVCFIALFGLALLFGVSLLVAPPSSASQWMFTATYLFIETAAAALVAARAALVARERSAWAIMAAGLVALVLGDAVEMLFGASTVGQSNSNASLLLYGVFFACTLVFLGTIAKARTSHARRRVWLDGLIAALGLLAFTSRLILPPNVEAGAPELLELLFVAAPLLFIALLVVIVVSLNRPPGIGWWAMLIAASLMAASNIALAQAVAVDSYTVGSPLDVLWPLATLFVALAAWAPPASPIVEEREQPSRGIIFAPAAFSGLALLVLLDAVVGRRSAIPESLSLLTLVAAILLLVLSVQDSARLRDKAAGLHASLQRAHDEALEAAKVKSNFLAWMSHEIRTPLTSVLGMNELLAETKLDATQRQYVSTVAHSGSLLSALVTDILDLSKLEAGSVELEQQPIDLDELAASSIAIVSYAAQIKGLSLVVERRDGYPRFILGDATRLRQILVNLLTNAVKFTSEGEVRLTLSRGRAAERVRFAVSDTGVGMEPDRITSLFEPFTQADASTFRLFGGTGLGLSICKALVALFGGEIEATSVPGRGSTFSFEFEPPIGAEPVGAEPVGAERVGPASVTPVEVEPVFAGIASRQAAAESTKSLRILVAEDDPSLRLFTSTLVTKLGHTVTAVSDGEAAYEQLVTGEYDVALVDLHMPKMGGREATRKLRQAGETVRQPRVIALTASATHGDRDACFEAGMDFYVSKPFTSQILVEALNAVAALPAHSHPSPVSDGHSPTGGLGEFSDELREQVLRRFVECSAQDVLAIEEAAADGQNSDVRFIAHRLRGSSMLVGADELADVCLRVELADDRVSIDPALTMAVRRALDAALAAIDIELHARL